MLFHSCCKLPKLNSRGHRLATTFLWQNKPYDIFNIAPELLWILSQRPDVGIKRLLESKSEVRVEPREGRDFPGWSVVVVHNVLVPVGGIEGVVLMWAEPEQCVAVVDVLKIKYFLKNDKMLNLDLTKQVS